MAAFHNRVMAAFWFNNKHKPRANRQKYVDLVHGNITVNGKTYNDSKFYLNHFATHPQKCIPTIVFGVGLLSFDASLLTSSEI